MLQADSCFSPTIWHCRLSLSGHHSCTYRISGSAGRKSTLTVTGTLTLVHPIWRTSPRSRIISKLDADVPVVTLAVFWGV